jgi:hypothetical protein
VGADNRAVGTDRGVYIWIRATVDWADEEAFLAQAPADVAAKLDLWNDTFTIPFHLFRLRVRQIAERNLAAVEGAPVAAWDEIPDGALVLPVDDDDWFAPDAAAALREALDPQAAAYHWPGAWVEVPTGPGHRVYLARRRLLPWTPEKWIFSTNNYAVVKREDTQRLAAGHVAASRWAWGEGAGSLRRIDRRLSVANRTIASRTSLRPTKRLTREQLVRKHRAYRRLYDRPPPPDLAWSTPYRAEMAAVMAALEIR